MGSVTGKALRQNGMTIKGFIDRRAEDIRQCIGLPVYDMDAFVQIANQETVIFVAVKNVYYHMEIAKSLYEHGFTRIIYKTIHAINGNMSDEEQVLDKAYESIYKTGDIPGFKIPEVEPKDDFYWKDPKILEENDDFVAFYAPLEQIYTGMTADQWTDVPVLSLIPYIRLFRYFEGDMQSSPDDYIKLCEEGARSENVEITESWKRYVLENRFHVFEQMRWRYDNESEFFVEQAPAVIWNEKGYFNLLTGKHRICFLAAMGRFNVPVKIKKEAWSRLCGENHLIEIRQMLKKNPDLKIPLPHFYFQSNKQYHCMFCQKKLRRVLERLYDENIMRGQCRKNCKLYDKTGIGYFSLLFSQMGFDVCADRDLPNETGKIYAKMGMRVSFVSEMTDTKAILLSEEVDSENEDIRFRI